MICYRYFKRLRFCVLLFLAAFIISIFVLTNTLNDLYQNGFGAVLDGIPEEHVDESAPLTPMVGGDSGGDSGSYWDRFASPSKLKKRDWHNYSAIAEDRQRRGPGEQGAALVLPKPNQQMHDDLFKSNGFNAYLSDFIALNRSINDLRHRGCKKKHYLAELPSVSVIIPFNNEHLSTLLRTVYSIVNRTPRKLLKEIVLADDFSTKEFLKDDLDKYVADHWPDLVKVVRAPQREGLIRTRLIGARAATGDVLLFLDSHSECNHNWLPPLLEPIALDYKTAVCPFVDVINHDNFGLRHQDEGARGAWDWQLFYKRLPLLSEDLKHPTEPFKDPVMAGGYFAISAKWFWELGGYDEGLDIWGGEQYELSFKIWQCGGTLVDAPCSRVGHIYKKFSASMNGGKGDFVGRNYKRVAEVWMDEFKEHIYDMKPHYRGYDPGDLTKQRALRERLNCKSFKWYMENIAFDQPKHYPTPKPSNGAWGRLIGSDEKSCIMAKFKDDNHNALQVGVEHCASQTMSTKFGQHFLLTADRLLKPHDKNYCLDVRTSESVGVYLDIERCDGTKSSQKWKYDVKEMHVISTSSHQCIERHPKERHLLIIKPCNRDADDQRWKFDYHNADSLRRMG